MPGDTSGRSAGSCTPPTAAAPGRCSTCSAADSEAERGRQAPVTVDRVRSCWGEQLHAYVVGAGRQVLGELGGNAFLLTVGDKRVDQRVAAAVGQVGVGPAEAAQVRQVVHEPEVALLYPP